LQAAASDAAGESARAVAAAAGGALLAMLLFPLNEAARAAAAAGAVGAGALAAGGDSCGTFRPVEALLCGCAAAAQPRAAPHVAAAAAAAVLRCAGDSGALCTPGDGAAEAPLCARTVASVDAALLTLLALYHPPAAAGAQLQQPPPPQLQQQLRGSLEWLAPRLPRTQRALALHVLAAACRALGARSDLGSELRVALAAGGVGDVRLRLADGGEPLHVHAAMLAARCPKLLPPSFCNGDVTLAQAVCRRPLLALLEWSYAGAVTIDSHADAVALAALARAAGAMALARLLLRTRGAVPGLAEDMRQLTSAPPPPASAVRLLDGAGHELAAHAFVCAARSPYFEAALRHCDPGGDASVRLPELDGAALAALRDWLYTDELGHGTDESPEQRFASLCALAEAAEMRLMPRAAAAAAAAARCALRLCSAEASLRCAQAAARSGGYSLAAAAAEAAAREFPALRLSGALDEVEPQVAEAVRRAHLELVGAA